MESQKTEAITLHSFPYRDKSRILKMYTKELGLNSFFITSTQGDFLTLCYPFCIAEVVFHKKKGDLCFLDDISILDTQVSLRDNYFSLISASKIANALLRSQLSEKKSDLLYQLLKSFLKKIPSFTDPTILYLAFYLKLLTHEGILNIQPNCFFCNTPSAYLCGGSCLCEKHQTIPFIFFDSEEWKILLSLLNAKQFTSLQEIKIPKSFPEKIELTFKSLI